jgi:hypothetical protein
VPHPTIGVLVVIGKFLGRGLTPYEISIDHLNRVLDEYAGELERGEFLVVTPGQIRVAGRPPS